MLIAEPKPILNSALPPQFRKIHIVLARESGHPHGDAGTGYIIIAPLDDNNRIDAKLWKQHREACRIARLRPGLEDRLGHLVHQRDGGWAFHYDTAENMPDEVGFHFVDESFRPGEYVSISDANKMHTYRVISVTRL